MASTLDTLHFKPGITYTFQIPDGRWIVYYGKRRITLSAFANWYTDTGYAQFLDAA